MSLMEEYDYYPDDQQAEIPRNVLFVLLDGTFVVRWSENRVQELETGQYRHYEKRDFGAAITDYELNQLKQVGLIEDFDQNRILLSPLPERQHVSHIGPWERLRNRSYYLNTTLPASLLHDVTDLLENLGFDDNFQARVRDDFVVLWGSKGVSFQKFDDVERARQLLVAKAPDAFQNTVVAFIETTRRD